MIMQDFNPYSIPSFIASILLLGLAVFVYKSNRRSPVNITFALECFVSFVWQFCYGMMYLFWHDRGQALLWMKIGYLGVIYISVFIYHFIIEFLGRKRERVVAYAAYAIAAVFTYLHLFTDLFTNGLIKYSWGYYPRASVLHPLFLAFFMGLISLSIFHTFYSFLKKDLLFNDNRREQIKYMVWAYFLYAPACIDFLPNYGIALYPFGFVFSTAFLAMIAYAIARHRLMDIEIIVKKTLVFAGLLASVFTILVLPTLLMQEYIFRGASSGGKLLGLGLSGIIIILSLRRIDNFLIRITDKYLFQKKYDYRELLKTFTSEVLTVVNLDKLVNLTVDKLIDVIKLSSSSILLLSEDKQQYDVVVSRNVKDPGIKLIRPDGIVTFLEHTHGYLLKKELFEKKVFIPPPIHKIIDNLSAELIIPIVLHVDVIGILTLGKKKSDEDYTQDDLDILLPLARTLAIAISNAKLFSELGRAQAEAAQKEKMAVIGTLSAGINHEICNPLGIARGQCEAFLLNLKDGLYNNKSPDELLVKAKEIMAKVIKETDRATAITKKLSSFAKPAKGEAEFVNIDKEIDDVLGLVNYELKLDKIEFEKQIEKGLHDIFVDKKQLQEVLFNLIRNAGQAIGEKGKIIVMAKESEGRVSIDVKDTGSGIPSDKLKELFNPFFTTKEPGKGTGLGLFIVRQVVEKNGGKIYLKESKVGEGTTFTVEFPVVVPQESKT
jgi:Signal transduction histidine kinase regulating C4-dicarboxylate transport system